MSELVGAQGGEWPRRSRDALRRLLFADLVDAGPSWSWPSRRSVGAVCFPSFPGAVQALRAGARAGNGAGARGWRLDGKVDQFVESRRLRSRRVRRPRFCAGINEHVDAFREPQV